MYNLQFTMHNEGALARSFTNNERSEPSIVRCALYAVHCLFFLLFALPVLAGSVSYEAGEGSLTFEILFERGYSNLTANKSGKELVISFDTTENIVYQPKDFFDSNIKPIKTKITSDGARKNFLFSFEGELIDPVITPQPESKSITVVFPLGTAAAAVPPPPVGVGAYMRMFAGLIFVLVFILLCYWVVKTFFKTDALSEIPGFGRLLGKADLALKRSLYFYELGGAVYVLGVTDANITLLDKVTDIAEINVLKSAFARRREFGSILKFVSKSRNIKADMDKSAENLEEKLSKFREK